MKPMTGIVLIVCVLVGSLLFVLMRLAEPVKAAYAASIDAMDVFTRVNEIE